MNNRRKKKQQQKSGGGGWIVTFSDLMSLLLTFFILLYSMSTIDAIKFQEVSNYLQFSLSGDGRPSILDGGQQFSPDPFDDSPLSDIDWDPELDEILEPASLEMMEMYDKVSGHVSEMQLEADVKVMMINSGVYVEIKDAILFSSGSSELKASGVDLLSKLEQMLNDFDNDIVVEGHTDNVPMKSKTYPSNWELSTARAVSVLRYLNESLNVDPTRLSARGYGEYSPIVPNDSEENKAKNRRVNLMILFGKDGET